MNKALQTNNFDLIRLFAASSVMILHLADHFKFNLGVLRSALDWFPGVPIFFVISGFLISRSWQARPNLAIYGLSRFLRIYPALWVCFLISLATVFAADYGIDAQPMKVFLWVAAQLTIGQFLTPSFLNDYGSGVLNGSLWTIPIELQFYFVLPFLLCWRPAIWLLVCGSLLSLGFVDDSVPIGQSIDFPLKIVLLPNFYMFFFGVFAALHFDVILPWVKNKVIVWLLIYLAVAFIATFLELKVGTNYPHPLVMWVLAILVLSAAYSGSESFAKVLRGNDVSYGIYIYHMVVANLLLEMKKGGFFLALALSIVCATLSWFAVERPMLKLKRRRKDEA